MANTFHFSVIVPAYNAEKTLRRCIDSILSQTFTDFELILIDDGSNDATPTMIDEYARRDSRIIALHKPNGGVSSARNLGLEKASGTYILFCDADDEVESDWIDSFSGYPDADLVVTGMKTVDKDRIKDVGFNSHAGDTMPKILSRCSFWTGTQTSSSGNCHP